MNITGEYVSLMNTTLRRAIADCGYYYEDGGTEVFRQGQIINTAVSGSNVIVTCVLSAEDNINITKVVLRDASSNILIEQNIDEMQINDLQSCVFVFTVNFGQFRLCADGEEITDAYEKL